jgi:hypothetical protein
MAISEQQRRANHVTLTRYLTKDDVRQRYGWASKISVDRAWQQYHTLPPPTLFQSRRPLWDVETLDAHDAARAFEATAV